MLDFMNAIEVLRQNNRRGRYFIRQKKGMFGFLRLNGVGKTTAIRCMMDLIRPLGGLVGFLGKDAQKDSVGLQKEIGYPDGSVRLHGKWTGPELIDFFHRLNGGSDYAVELGKRLGFTPSVPVKQHSSGSKQKFGIINAFMSWPEVPNMSTLENPLLRENFSPVFPIMAIFRPASVAGRAIAGEIESGFVELLAGHPVWESCSRCTSVMS